MITLETKMAHPKEDLVAEVAETENQKIYKIPYRS